MKTLLDLGFKGEQIKITIDEVNRQVHYNNKMETYNS